MTEFWDRKISYIKNCIECNGIGLNEVWSFRRPNPIEGRKFRVPFQKEEIQELEKELDWLEKQKLR